MICSSIKSVSTIKTAQVKAIHMDKVQSCNPVLQYIVCCSNYGEIESNEQQKYPFLHQKPCHLFVLVVLETSDVFGPAAAQDFLIDLGRML